MDPRPILMSLQIIIREKKKKHTYTQRVIVNYQLLSNQKLSTVSPAAAAAAAAWHSHIVNLFERQERKNARR